MILYFSETGMNHPMFEQIQLNKLCFSTFIRFFLGFISALLIIGIFSLVFQHIENTTFYIYISLAYGFVFSLYYLIQTLFRAYRAYKQS